MLTTAPLEYDVQTPSEITALYNVVWDKLIYVSVLLVFGMVVHVPPPLVEYSHLITGAEFPVNVSVPLFDVTQEVVTAGEIVPPVGEGVTVTITEAVLV